MRTGFRLVVCVCACMIFIQNPRSNANGISVGLDSRTKEQLRLAVKEAKVVMLGEPTHGEGNVFLYKAEMVKYLHDSLGFNVIAFESGLYDMFYANELIKKNPGNDASDYLYQSLFSVWTDSREFAPLLEWINGHKSEITLAGFDCQLTGVYAPEYLVDSTMAFINRNQDRSTNINASLLKEAVHYFADYYTYPAHIPFPDFKAEVSKAIELLNSIDTNVLSETDKANKELYLQMQRTLLAMGNDYYSKRDLNLNEKTFKAYHSNVRDSLMAQNLLYLAKKYPNEKVICWGAGAHFMYSPASVESEELQSYTPMGMYVQNALGKDLVFNLTFIASRGVYGIFDEEIRNLPVPQQANVEGIAGSKKCPFIDLRSQEFKDKMLTGYALEYTPVTAVWSNLFDAFIYLDSFTANTFKLDEAIENDHLTATIFDSSISYYGKIIDEETNEPVAYATVSILQDNFVAQILTDENGVFKTSMDIDNTITVAAVGYESQQSAITRGKSISIFLKRIKNTLDEVVITASRPRQNIHEIIEHIERNIDKNYKSNDFSRAIRLQYLVTNHDTLLEESRFYYNINSSGHLVGNSAGKGSGRQVKNAELLRLIGNTPNRLVKDLLSLDIIRHSETIFYDNNNAGYTYNLIKEYNDSLLGIIYLISFSADRLSPRYTNMTFAKKVYGEIKVRKADYAIISVRMTVERDINKIRQWTQKLYQRESVRDSWRVMPNQSAIVTETDYALDTNSNQYIVVSAKRSWFVNGYLMENKQDVKLAYMLDFLDVGMDKAWNAP